MDDNNDLEDKIKGKAKNIGKKVLKRLLFSKVIIVIIAILLIIVLISGLAWAQELITFKDTSSAIRNGGKIKVKDENGEDIEIDVKSINELVKIKGNSTTGYYFNIDYLQEYVNQMMEQAKIENSDLNITHQGDLLKKMIMAELTTQYPDITKDYVASIGSDSNAITDNFKGSINIKRISADDMSDSDINQSQGLKNYLIVGDSYISTLKNEYEMIQCDNFYVESDKAADYWVDNFDKINTDKPKGIIVSLGISNYNTISKMKQLLQKLHDKYDNIPIYVLNVLPTSSEYDGKDKDTINSKINKYNTDIKNYCEGKGFNFIDVSQGLISEDGYLENTAEDHKNLGTLDSNTIFYNNMVQAINELYQSKQANLGENIKLDDDRIIDLKYIAYDELKQKIEDANNGILSIKDVLKYYSLDDDMNLIVAKQDGDSSKVSESSKINYSSIIQKYTIPFEYLLSFLIDGQDEDFIKDFIDLVFDSNITIMVMDEKTEVTTVDTTSIERNGSKTNKITDSSESYSKTQTNISSPTTKVSYSTKIEVIYVDTWFVKATSTFNYISESISTPGTYSEPTIENVTDESIGIMSEFSGEKSTSTKTDTTTLNKKFQSGNKEAKDNTDRICILFKNSKSARETIMSDASWLLEDLLENNEKTVDMIELTKYWLQKATGKDFGVDEFDFSIFNITSFNSVNNTMMGLLKEYIHYWEHSTPPPTNADGTMYIIENDGAGHPTVGYGVDIFNGGFEQEFTQAGYPTSIGGEVPVEFVDALEEREIQQNLNSVESITSGMNLQEYQIIALVSRTYNCGVSGALVTTRGSPSMNFTDSYNAYWKTEDDQFEAKNSVANFGHLLYNNYMSKPITSEGKVLEGLVRRRKSEWILFQTGYFDVLNKWCETGGSILECAKNIHEYMESNNYTYCVYGGNSYEECGKYGKSHGLSITFEESKSNKNCCCATFVSWVLQEAGYLTDSEHTDSAEGLTALLIQKGWSVITDSSQFQPGDVLSYSNHVEIYAGDGKIYNAGSGNAIRGNSPGNMYRTCNKALRAPN